MAIDLEVGEAMVYSLTIQFYLAPHLIHEAHAGSRPIPVYGNSGDAVEGQAEVFFDLDIHVIKVKAIRVWL